MEKSFLSSLWLPFFSGILLLLATPYGGAWPVAAFALVPFFVHFSTLRTRRQIVISSMLMATPYCFAEGESLYHLAGTWWVSASATGTMMISVTYTIGVSILILIGASSYFAPMLFWAKIKRTSLLFPLIAALSIAFIEFIRSVVFFAGYSWGTMGYLLVDTMYVRQIASVIGVYGLTFILVFWNAWIALMIIRYAKEKGSYIENVRAVFFGEKYYLETIVVGLLFVFIALFGAYRESFATSEQLHLRVAVISSIVRTEDSINEESYHTYRNLMEEALSKGSTLILTPENVFPYFVIDESRRTLASRQPVNLPNASALWEDFLTLSRAYPKTTFALAVHTISGEKNYNSILLYQNGVLGDIYHKRKPIPFTEFVPFGLPMKIFETISSGANVQDFRIGEMLLGGYICSEVGITPLSVHGAKLILSPSNDSVLVGNTILLLEHQFAQMRALESDAFMLRSTKGGISSIIDPSGNTIESMSGQNGVIVTDI
ncbi:MAG: Apolipoprotein N-acyltransferase [Parcubacteria group bacterium GW2011_GWA2_47_7]|nr:MAG: Apolipoprotein N-acyltransferase [Parcubacteria group bacterium GW2011_GWA2_47_7]